MSLIRKLWERWFIGDPGDPSIIDYSLSQQQVTSTPTVKSPRPLPSAPPDWESKRREAAAKFGQAFKCAADGLPRETMVEGKFVDVEKARGANVTKISDRKRSK